MKLPAIPIGVVSRLVDPEGADFADDIAGAFSNAHWQAVRQKNWTKSDRGVAIATLEGTASGYPVFTGRREAIISPLRTLHPVS